MAVFTVDELITRAKDAADMHDLFVRPSTWFNWLNVELQALYIMCARGGWPLRNIQFRSFSVPTDYISGSFQIPFEILAIVGVWEVDGQARYRRLTYNNGADALRQFPGATGITGHPREYWISELTGTSSEATQVIPYPTPTSGLFHVAYLPAPSKVAATTDTVALPMGIEELIVLKMARRALVKEEADTTAIEKLIAAQMQTVEEYLWDRNLANSPKIRNTDDVERGWGWYSQIMYPPAIDWAWL